MDCCGHTTYRQLSPSDNTGPWIRWMREHGIPVNQVPLDGWVRRDEKAKQVTVLVYDWGAAELEKAPSTALAPDLPVDEIFRDQSCHAYGDGKGGIRTREFVSQLNREPAPFPA